MPKSKAPIPMLEKCRARFIAIRDWERAYGGKGGEARANIADEFAKEITATLRDWG